MLERLESAFARQQAFVANASHELRTPLAIVRAELDATLADPACDEQDLRAMAEVIADATARSENLIDRLLVLARSERSAIHPEPVDLASLARAAIDDLRGSIEARSLIVRPSLDRARGYGDSILLTSLVGNLIENAVRHNVAGGAVWVRTAEEGRLTVVEIENDGAVLAPERVPELFEPFRRLRRIAEPELGVGLGLAIAQAVAVAHDGRVLAEARPAGGLAVRVDLPLAPAAGTAAAAATLVRA
jgi:signal transduction histidine kinase